jgi:fatty-acyl-CoA synthase
MSTPSYVCGTSSIPLIGDTIGASFDRAVARWGPLDALVVRHQGIRWTYAELKERVDAVAAGLIAIGLAPGDRVGIWSPNTAEWVLSQFATAKAGLILVNINPAYRLAELEHALCRSGCKALVTATRFKNSDYLEMVSALISEQRVPQLRAVIHLGEHSRAGIMRFADLVDCGSAAAQARLAEHVTVR